MRRFRFVLVIGLVFATWQISSSFAWGGWIIQTVDSEGVVGHYTSIALDSSGHPHISYQDYGNEDLKYARWDGKSWIIQTVDSEGDVGESTSIALDSSDYPHISYGDETVRDLKYARWTPGEKAK